MFSETGIDTQLRLMGAADMLGRRYRPAAKRRIKPGTRREYDGTEALWLGQAGGGDLNATMLRCSTRRG